MEIPLTAYGQHLLIDCYDATPEQCYDVSGLYNFLMELPASIGMTRIGFPNIIKIDTPGIQGLSGFVFIMESHISVHTYAERGFVTMDVYSCKSFDESKVLEQIKNNFKCTDFEHSLQIRGKRFNEKQPTTSP